ncbi:MAG: hypothetical protein ABW250_02545 [Pyrinomonadaceae bacterium]
MFSHGKKVGQFTRRRLSRFTLFFFGAALTILNLLGPLGLTAYGQDACNAPPGDSGGGDPPDEVPYDWTCWDVWDCTSWYDWSGSSWNYGGTYCYYSGTFCY